MSAKRKGTPPEPCLPKLRALGDATRMRLLKALARGPSPVSGLADTLGLSVYNTSKHLKVLKEAGLVETEVCAQQRIYRLSKSIGEASSGDRNLIDLGCCSFRLDEIEN